MNERPIIFSAAMVRAILAGKKTQTRRLALNKAGKPSGWERVQPGDVLWVRETWCDPEKDGRYLYRADMSEEFEKETRNIERAFRSLPTYVPWRSSIHMPRAACRIKLGVEEVRIERLQAINRNDVAAEGIFVSQPPAAVHTAIAEFASLWDTLYGPGSWFENPEVVPISFRML